MKKLLLVLSVFAMGALAAACSQKSSGDAGGPGAEGTSQSIGVTLTDDSVTLESTSVPAGEVTFEAVNEGSETHEIEVFEGDADPASLPISSNVADTEGWTLVDEIEDVTPGASANLTVDLSPGTYQVVCNLPGYFEKGMYSTLTVT